MKIATSFWLFHGIIFKPYQTKDWSIKGSCYFIPLPSPLRRLYELSTRVNITNHRFFIADKSFAIIKDFHSSLSINYLHSLIDINIGQSSSWDSQSIAINSGNHRPLEYLPQFFHSSPPFSLDAELGLLCATSSRRSWARSTSNRPSYSRRKPLNSSAKR